MEKKNLKGQLVTIN